ncbi:MAG TPA: DUF6544 family protein [Blastocatellia bacterium]|nr:DUF6544 family protein [Blastocatellia bacterium]
MPGEISLDELWSSAPAAGRAFQPDQIAGLPRAARRYLEHAIAPGTPLASAVRLRMHGEIRLRRWLPFSAEQVICRDRGMIWRAGVRMYGIPVRGSDCFIDGEGLMKWGIFGLIPLVKAAGPDISRSAAGRFLGESFWLPSMFCGEDVSWAAQDASRLQAALTSRGHTAELELTVSNSGRLEAVRFPRWGNPEGAEFHYADFGGVMEEEGRFGGYTIPTRIRGGWHFGTDRFESEGEFFRARVDEAVFR